MDFEGWTTVPERMKEELKEHERLLYVSPFSGQKMYENQEKQKEKATMPTYSEKIESEVKWSWPLRRRGH